MRRSVLDADRSPVALTPATGRLALLAFIFAVFGAWLLARMYTIQVHDAPRYRELAMEERRASIPLIPKRGNLLDRRGHPLAVSVPYDSVYVLGPLVGDPAVVAQKLAPILDMPPEAIQQKIRKDQSQPAVLKSRVPSAIGEQVRKLQLPGIHLQNEPIREYPEGSVASQILGFVGQDFNGLAGLEFSYQDELGGTPGRIETEKDPAGQEIVLARRVLVPPSEGSDLVLTLDRTVQRTAERLLGEAVVSNKAGGGLILVMEPSTGSIVAAAANPTYSLTEKLYRPGQEALTNSTVATNQFEPGSTMKLITMASAIEEGLVSPGTTYDDAGVANVAGTLIHNWDGAANGRITMTQVLVKSSNVAAQWVAGLLGPDRFYRYVDAFGFGSRTGSGLPGEVAGTVRAVGDPGWTRVDLATNAYGQGIAVTPLQLIAAVASLANDGVLMRPRLVQEIHHGEEVSVVPPTPVRRVVSAETARAIRSMMVSVAQQEALIPHRIPGYTVALKTGTADTTTTLGYDTSRTFASVVAFLPADDPRLVVLIRLDGPEAIYGGVVAAPLLKQLALELLPYYQIPPGAALSAARVAGS